MATTQTKPVDESQALVKILNDSMPELKRLAPKYVNLSRLMALALEARMRTPLLAKCSIDSIVAFCKRCAEWGTDRVGAGGVWPVPFWSTKNNCYEAVAIPDWRFLIEKAKKAKAIKHATADIVREGDKFEVIRGLHPDLIHTVTGATGAVRAAYCRYILPDGTEDFQVMWIEELEKVRDSSNAWKTYKKDNTKTNPYNYWPEEMHKKAVVKRTMKLFEGASIELTTLLQADHRAMGFADYSETPEPITMPKAIETTATSEEPGQHKQEGTEQGTATAAAVTVIPEGWIKGKDSKKKTIPHPHAGRPITEVPTADLTVIMEGLRADPKVPGKAKDEKYQTLLVAIEEDVKQRAETAKAGQQEGKKEDQPEQSQPTGTPLDQALAKIKTIVTINALLKLWTDYEKDIATWTGQEQSSFKMAFDGRMTEIKENAKEGKLL
jgi:recombination protein RecT